MNADDPSLPRGDASQPIDDLAGSLLDERVPLEPHAAESLSADDRRRLVDLQWIDALLTHRTPSEAAAVNRAVAGVLAKLGEPKLADSKLDDQKPKQLSVVQPRQTVRRRRWWPAASLSSIAAAALVMIALGVWWQRGAQQAMAMVERSYQAALAPRDRVYDVTVERTGGSMRPLKSTLTVRGGDKFLFEKRGPLGAMIRLGTDGQGYWFIPPAGAVVRAKDDAFLPAWMRRTSTELPYLQVSTLLARMRDYYQLQRLPDEAIAADGPKLSHLRATWSARRLRPSKHGRNPPEVVEMWSDPATGVVEQLVLTLPIDEGRRQAHTVTLRLAEERTLGDETYRAETYAPIRESVTAPAE